MLIILLLFALVFPHFAQIALRAIIEICVYSTEVFSIFKDSCSIECHVYSVRNLPDRIQ